MKVKSLFDHLKDLHTKSIKWEDLTESDKKTFSVFMINRFLSMNPDYTDFINSLQRVIHNMNPQFVYKLYMEVLPKQSGFFAKYIKATNSKIYDSKLLNLLASYLKVAEYEIVEWLDLHSDLEFIKPILLKFGLEDKEILRMTKIKENEK
jgi:hypothetical protein